MYDIPTIREVDGVAPDELVVSVIALPVVGVSVIVLPFMLTPVTVALYVGIT